MWVRSRAALIDWAVPRDHADLARNAGRSALAARGAERRRAVVGFAAAFVSALVVVRLFLRYVGRHTFAGFAWYRIALGIVVLSLAAR